MKLWLIVASPFIGGVVVILTIKACEAWDKYRERRDMRIRDENLNRYNIAAFRGTKDRYE